MRILSWNVNGLRAVYRKDFLKWLKRSKADIVCLQETKAQPEQLPSELINVAGYHAYFNSAAKKGYSGVAVYTKKKPLLVETKLGLERFDQEGRMLKLKYSGFSLINLYLPHGGRGKENLEYKLEVYEELFRLLSKVKNEKVILLGDFNIAHREIDLARPKDNKNNIMFTPEEREQINKIITIGFTDTFREFHKGGGNYTWWPYFVDARKRNIGWRIDYIFASKSLSSKIKQAFILPEVRGSDHCPVGVLVEM